MRLIYGILLIFIVFQYALRANAQTTESYSPSLRSNYPQQVYFGDTHLHSSLSWDSYLFANKKFGPDEAYRFAKGETLIEHDGRPVKLERPLDFLVVADHAGSLGVIQGLEKNDSNLLKNRYGKQWSSVLDDITSALDQPGDKAARITFDLFVDIWLEGPATNSAFRQTVWGQVLESAERHNNPGQFTSLIGYEWTQSFYNLHRVVIFRYGKDKVGQILPFTRYQSNNPEKLWQHMASYEQKTGGQVLAIPHNGNLSNGVMFALETASGKPLTKDYAAQRSRWEPLFEVTQIKGDSEMHPLLSPDDTFSDFERISTTGPTEDSWNQKAKERVGSNDFDSWVQKNIESENKSWMHTYEYARPALKLGLQQQHKLGVNPFKFGMIGSTDSHTSLATADENNFWGKLTLLEPSRQRISGSWHPDIDDYGEGYGRTAWRMNAAGYTAVWATENTREALFDAMTRKEVYATTGPRMSVRFFGGWDYEPSDAFKPDLASVGYNKGVPMGGDLVSAPAGTSPTFLIRAVKDPEGANLDRVQVIKGWHDVSGKIHEKIYNVALSDNRQDRGVKTEPVGSTVDVPNASYTNTIGSPELAVVWRDPDFDTDELAFYYLRVLEIPTPRWTAYDAKYFQLKDLPDEIPMVTQERAYTSPIWYTPIE